MGLLLLGIVLAFYGGSIAAIGYGLYALTRNETTPTRQAGALFLIVGGAVCLKVNGYLGIGLMLVGLALSFDLIGFGASDEPSPAAGWAAVVFSLPLLGVGGAFVWLNVVIVVWGAARGTPGDASPLVFGVGLGALVLGLVLFFWGYGKARLSEKGPAARFGAPAAALLCACAFALVSGQGLARAAARALLGEHAPEAPALEASAGPLVSSDGAITLELPAGWRRENANGTVLAASKGRALVSISAAGAAKPRAELVASLEKSRADAAAGGAVLKGTVETRGLAGGGVIGWFRFDLRTSSCSLSELATAAGREYSVFARDLDAEDQAALERSLEKL